MIELIKVTQGDNGEQLVSARELHTFLEAGSNVNTWFKNQSERAMLEDGIDFSTFYVESTGGRPAKEYLLTVDAVKNICLFNKRNPKAAELYKNLVTDKEVIIIQRKRKEIEFGEMLDKVFGTDSVKRQVFVCDKYFIDFIISDKIIVEYDETHHQFNTDKDLKRQKEIMKKVDSKIKFIRILEGNELEGIGQIFKTLIKLNK